MGFLRERLTIFYLGAYLPALLSGLILIPIFQLSIPNWQAFYQSLGILQTWWGGFFGIWLFLFLIWDWTRYRFRLVEWFRLQNRFDYLMVGFMVTNLISFFWGGISGNPLRYLLGDTLKGFVFPVTYFLFRNSRWEKDFIWKFIVLLIVAESVSMILFVYEFPVINFSGRTLIYSSGLILLAEARNPKYQILLAGLLSVGILVLMTSQAYRGNLIVFSVLVILTFLYQVNRQFSLKKVFLVLVMAAIFLVVYGSLKILNPEQIRSVVQRIQRTVVFREGNYRIDDSLSQRTSEYFDVMEKFRTSHAISWIFGYGNGAMLPNTKMTDVEYSVYQTRLKHNIYVTPLAIFYRNGLIGFIIYFVLWIWLAGQLLGLRSWIHQTIDPEILVQFKYFLLLHISIFVLSFIVYIYVGNPIVAISIVLLRKIKYEIGNFLNVHAG